MEGSEEGGQAGQGMEESEEGGPAGQEASEQKLKVPYHTISTEP